VYSYDYDWAPNSYYPEKVVVTLSDQTRQELSDSSKGSAPTARCDNCCAKGFGHEEHTGIQVGELCVIIRRLRLHRYNLLLVF
jgi:hypothetical protein